MTAYVCTRCKGSKYCKYSLKPFQPNISMNEKATREAFDEFRHKCQKGTAEHRMNRR